MYLIVAILKVNNTEAGAIRKDGDLKKLKSILFIAFAFYMHNLTKNTL